MSTEFNLSQPENLFHNSGFIISHIASGRSWPWVFIQLFLANYFTSHFGFHCYYTASTTTADSDYSVSTKIHNSDIEKFVNWDSTFALTIFSDPQFTVDANPAALIIGDTLYVRATWMQDFSQRGVWRFSVTILKPIIGTFIPLSNKFLGVTNFRFH